MSAKQTRDPEEALASNFASVKPGERLEVWSILAHLVFAVFLAGLLYLGARPGGPTPVFVFLEGRFLLALAALALLGIGGFTSLLRRPILQRGRLRSFLFVVVVFGLVNMQVPYPSPHEGHPSATRFRIPVRGEWTVFWGGEDPECNRLASFLPDRRFGLDLVLSKGGKLFDGDGAQLSDWYGFGEDVLAPAAGTVVRVQREEPDQLPKEFDRALSAEGNLVVLETATGEYCFLSHLKQGSVSVAEGESVLEGQKIGEVGSSGFSAFTPLPHLALHLQDTSEPRGEAIPWRFHDYQADGKPIDKGIPTGGVSEGGSPIGQRVADARSLGSGRLGEPASGVPDLEPPLEQRPAQQVGD